MCGNKFRKENEVIEKTSKKTFKKALHFETTFYKFGALLGRSREVELNKEERSLKTE